jgi:hypothetical protein
MIHERFIVNDFTKLMKDLIYQILQDERKIYAMEFYSGHERFNQGDFTKLVKDLHCLILQNTGKIQRF